MKFNTCALVVQLLTQNSQAIRLDQNQNQHQKSATGAKDPIDNVYIAGSKETWNPKLQIYSLLQEGAKNAAVYLHRIDVKAKEDEEREDDLFDKPIDMNFNNMLQIDKHYKHPQSVVEIGEGEDTDKPKKKEQEGFGPVVSHQYPPHNKWRYDYAWPHNSTDVGLPAEAVYTHPTESGKYVTYGGFQNSGKSLLEMDTDQDGYHQLFQRSHHKAKRRNRIQNKVAKTKVPKKQSKPKIVQKKRKGKKVKRHHSLAVGKQDGDAVEDDNSDDDEDDQNTPGFKEDEPTSEHAHHHKHAHHHSHALAAEAEAEVEDDASDDEEDENATPGFTENDPTSQHAHHHKIVHQPAPAALGVGGSNIQHSLYQIDRFAQIVSSPQGKLLETVKLDGTKTFELLENPKEIPMAGVDPDIEKRVQKLAQYRAQQLAQAEDKPKPKPLGAYTKSQQKPKEVNWHCKNQFPEGQPPFCEDASTINNEATKALPSNDTDKTGDKLSLVQTILDDVKKDEQAEKEKAKFPPVEPITYKDALKIGQTKWKCLDNSADLAADGRQIPPFCEHDKAKITKDATDALSTVNSKNSTYKSITNMGPSDKAGKQGKKPKEDSLAQFLTKDLTDMNDVPYKAGEIKADAEAALKTVNSNPNYASVTNIVQLQKQSPFLDAYTHGDGQNNGRAESNHHWDCKDNLPVSDLTVPNVRAVPPYCEHSASVIKNQAEDALRTINSQPNAGSLIQEEPENGEKLPSSYIAPFVPALGQMNTNSKLAAGLAGPPQTSKSATEYLPPGTVLPDKPNADTWDTRTMGGKNLITELNAPRYQTWLDKNVDIDPYTGETRQKLHPKSLVQQINEKFAEDEQAKEQKRVEAITIAKNRLEPCNESHCINEKPLRPILIDTYSKMVLKEAADSTPKVKPWMNGVEMNAAGKITKQTHPPIHARPGAAAQQDEEAAKDGDDKKDAPEKPKDGEAPKDGETAKEEVKK